MKKLRVLSLILVVIMIFTLLPSSFLSQEAQAEGHEQVITKVSTVLGHEQVSNGLVMNMFGDTGNHDPLVKEIAGQECWAMQKEGDLLFMFGNVDDQFLFGGVNQIQIEVTYYDSGNGLFGLIYNREEDEVTEKWADDVILFTNTGTWKTHTFNLPDAALNNNVLESGKDFRLGVYVPGHDLSVDPVYISNIAVCKTETDPQPEPETEPESELEPEPRSEVSAILGYEQISDGLVMNMKGDGDYIDPLPTVIDGQECWTMQQVGDLFYMYGDVEDSFLYGGSNPVEVEVTYFDGSNGLFSLLYNSEESIEIWSDVVELRETNQWRTKTFTLPNAALNNSGIFNKDFRLGVYVNGHGFSASPVYISKIVVRKLEPKTTVQAKIESSHVGNIFYNREDYDLNLKLISDYADQKDITLTYKVKNYNNSLLSEHSQQVTLDGNGTRTIPLELSAITEYGTFRLEVTISDNTGSVNEFNTFPFSRILAEATTKMNLLGACTHFGMDRGDIQKNIKLAADAGIQWIRDEMYWSEAETVKGQVDILPKWDEYVDTAIANGIKPLIILDYGNPFYDNGQGPVSDEGIAAFANYCKVIVEHFKGRVEHFEIWNEWNWGTGNTGIRNGTQYGKLLTASSAAIRAANPDAYIIGLGMAVTDINYVKDVLNYPGAYEAMDAIAFHPYTYPSSPEGGGLEGRIDSVIGVFGDKPVLPIWLTEMGWPTHNGGVTEVTSGSYGVRMLTWALANQDKVEHIFWYDLQNDGTDKGYNEDNFGLVDYWQNLEVPWAAKSNYAALSAFTTKLAGCEFVKSYNFGTGNYAYQFKRLSDQKDILVMWTDGSSSNVGINVAGDTVTITDLFGNQESMPTVNHTAGVYISSMPLYVEGVLGSDISLGDSSFQLAGQYSAASGSTLDVDITRNEAAILLSGEYRLQLPDGWSVQNTLFETGGELDTLQISIPLGTADGNYTLTLRAVVDGKVLFTSVFNVSIYAQKEYELAPYLLDNSDLASWAMAFTINNSGSESSGGTVRIVEPQNWANSETYQVAAGRNTRIIFDIPEAPGQNLYEVKLEVTKAGEETIIIERNISFLAAVKANNSILADGVLEESEWNGAMPFVLDDIDQYVNLDGSFGGTEDLNAKGYLKWDENYMYLAVDVEDDSHYQAGTGDNIWSGDALQFCFDPGRSREPGFYGYNEIGFGQNSFDNKTYHWKWISYAGKNGGLMDASTFAAINNGSHTYYEAAIPWSDIAPADFKVQKDAYLGFSLLINDNDLQENGNNSRKGFLEYMSGIGLEKNCNLFGDLLLVEVSIPVIVDKEQLREAIKDAESLIDGGKLKNGTSSLIKEFNAAYNLAVTILSKEDAGQTEVDNAVIGLTRTFSYFIDSEKDEYLEELISYADNYILPQVERGKYSTASGNAFMEALAVAKSISNDPSATDALRKQAAEDLLDSITALVRKPDKSGLQALIESASSIDLTKYTSISVKALKKSIGDAKDVLVNKEASQEEINNAMQGLNNAINSLELRSDKKYLQELVDKAEGINSLKYTQESVEALKKAIADAKAVLGKENAIQDEIKNAYDNLQKVMDELNLKDMKPVSKGTTTTANRTKTNSNSNSGLATGDSIPWILFVLFIGSISTLFIFRRKKKYS